MGSNKPDLRAKLLEIIKEIGKNKDDCRYFDMNTLLDLWNARYKGKFKQYGFGKMSDFLRSEVGVEESDGKHWIKITASDTSQETEKGACEKSISHSATCVDTASTSHVTASPRNDSLRPKSKEDLLNLKLEVLISIQDYLEKNAEKIRGKPYFKLDTLNSAWAQKHPDTSFKKKGFGSFKSFLADKLQFQQPKGEELSDCFKITLSGVKSKLKLLEGGESNRGSISTQPGGDEKNQDSDESRGESAKRDDCIPATIINTTCNDSDAVEGLPSSNKPNQTCIQPEPKSKANSTSKRRLTHMNVVDKGFSEEECNFMRLATMLYRCGLKALRELFQRIHPSWKNGPGDIARFTRGEFRLSAFEEAKFSGGNIHKWDITLICKVLLYSGVSKERMKEEAFQGYEDAIKSIRNIKNDMLSHNDSNTIVSHDYENAIEDLRNSVIKIGFDEGMFDATLTGVELSKEDEYYKECLEELGRLRKEQKESLKKLLFNQDVMKKDLSDVKESLNQSKAKQILRSQPEWEEWIKVKKKLRGFDVDNNHYIFIVDRLEEVNSELVKVLANVPWKLVIDLDPNSDIDGFLSKIKPSATKGGVVATITPSKLNGACVDDMIDVKRMQWLFANGRNREVQHESDDQNDNRDREKNDISLWNTTFKGPIQELIRACCQKLDKMKPIFCIAFRIRSGISTQIAQEILGEIHCKFMFRNFSASYLSFTPELNLKGLPNAVATSLSPSLFLVGLKSLLGNPDDKYRLPSNQKGLEVVLNQMQYNFLSEYLEVLYIGCEDIPSEATEKEKQLFEDEHLKHFLCGKAISFPSLHYGHDAKRSLTKEVLDRAIDMLYRIPKTRIVQITHTPGSGGTTIARRVLWDLHTRHPCAIVKFDHAPENFTQASEGENYLSDLCERIVQLEDICETIPAILIDGNSTQVRILSDCLARGLEGRALILRCTNYMKLSDKDEAEFQSNQANKGYCHSEDECILSDQNDTYFSEDDEFKVNPKIKNDDVDYKEFKMKYDKYCQMFPRPKRGEMTCNRIFHFPMMVMLEEFEKLEPIVNESLKILKDDEAVEYEIAILIAFVQVYSRFPTPGSLVAKLLNTNLKTYSEITEHFSETLINLMVPEKACSKERFIANSISGPVLESYTFQHPEIATLVLKYSGRNVDQIIQDFLQHKVLEDYQKNDGIKSLLDNLFFHNKRSTGNSFSILVYELAKEDNGGRIFEDAAKQTKDVAFFSHVARFFAFKYDFVKARDLIKEGFKVDGNVTKEKKRNVYNAEGYIVLKQIKYKCRDGEISDIECLKKLSQEAFYLFREARDNPPRKFPLPLIGEVKVWQYCIQWILKRNAGDVKKAVKFIMLDSFFACAISKCFHLLNEVDRIVETVPTLKDPGYTKQVANKRRRILVQTIGRMRNGTGKDARQTPQIYRLCDEIVSKYKRTAPEKEIICLRVQWMLNGFKRQLYLLDRTKVKDLFAWLKTLVNDFEMLYHTRDLMEAAAEQIQPPFDIDEALKIVNRWQKDLPNDPFSYLYEYMFCFSEVRQGSVLQYRTSFESALDKCRKKSEGNMRINTWQYFLGKNGDGICAFLNQSKLKAQHQNKHKPKQQGEVLKLDETFWKEHGRDLLLECKGRIECTPKSFSKKNDSHIIMEPGNIRVYVSSHVIGKAYMDYQPDSRVSFVVCFTLNGPKALGILFD